MILNVFWTISSMLVALSPPRCRCRDQALVQLLLWRKKLSRTAPAFLDHDSCHGSSAGRYTTGLRRSSGAKSKRSDLGLLEALCWGGGLGQQPGADIRRLFVMQTRAEDLEAQVLVVTAQLKALEDSQRQLEARNALLEIANPSVCGEETQHIYSLVRNALLQALPYASALTQKRTANQHFARLYTAAQAAVAKSIWH